MALKYPELFQPFHIGKLEIKNKIVMSGMHNIGWTDAYDLIDDCVIDYFEARAKGGVGLIFTGANQPDFQYDNGVIMKNPFQNPTTFVSRHKKLVDRVHTYGTKLFIQFGYGGGRVDFPTWIPGQGIAPSDCPNRWDPSIQHRAMTKAEIQSVIDASISAAALCLQTGCDGIDINCYGGYTIDQFLQPCFNKRTDAYGGLDGGIKIMSEIVQGIKRVCGKNFPVTCRLGMRQHIKAIGQGGLDGEDYVEYGRTPEQSIYVAKKLAEAGYDAIYLGNGTYDSFYWLYPPMYQKEGLWLDDVEALTRQIDVPVICGGKILQPQMANDAIRDGKVSMVKVNMGAPILQASLIPVVSEDEQVIDAPIEVNGQTYRFTAVSMGNPHAIVYMDDVDGLDIEKIGPSFESHVNFPDRVNTEFVRVIDRHTVQMRVWERGSGETHACGTGACAVAVSSILNGLVDRNQPVTVKLLGGDLNIFWDESDDQVYMTGPATTVFDGEIDLGFLGE